MDLSPSFPLIVGHRGAGHDAPENTLASFRLAWEQGADAVEADLRRTRDGEVVVMHDATTLRTSGVDWVVAEKTLAELKTLDVGSWKNVCEMGATASAGRPCDRSRPCSNAKDTADFADSAGRDTRASGSPPRSEGSLWAGERVPTLGELLGTVPGGRGVFLEVKCGAEVVPAIAQGVGRSGVRADRVVVMSFDAGVVSAVRRAMPRCAAHLLFEFVRDGATGRWNATREEVVGAALRAGAQGVGLGLGECVDGAMAELLVKAGLGLGVWTVNDPAEARRMIALGARSLTTDRPGWMRGELSRSAAESR